MRWTAFAYRSISLKELHAAISTKTDVDATADIVQRTSAGTPLFSAADLQEVCSSLLKIRDNGLVYFLDPGMRDFVLSPAMSALNHCPESQVHETMAAVCLHHLRCLHPKTIFRPWLLTERWMSERCDACHLRSYATSFWHIHFRVAQGHSRHLPAILDRVVRSALAEEASQDGYELVDPEYRVNSGLRICSLYNLTILGKLYLQMGADVTCLDTLSATPLHVASSNSSIGMIRLLLEEGADPNTPDSLGRNALHHSSIAGPAEAVSLLLQYGADVDAPTSGYVSPSPWSCLITKTPLQLAASQGHLDVVTVLLAAGSNLHAAMEHSQETALHLAVKSGNLEVVQFLLEKGADLEAETITSETPLLIALEERHEPVIELLISSGAQLRGISVENQLCVLKALDKLGLVQSFEDMSMEQTKKRAATPSLTGLKYGTLVNPLLQTAHLQPQLEDFEEDGWLVLRKSSSGKFS